MKNDYQEQLKTFSTPEDYDQTKVYFENYWLDLDEYVNNWHPIQHSIFNSKAKHLPDMMFSNNFELIPLIGGNIFTSHEDFALFQNCMRQTKDESFVIVQNPEVIIKVYMSENNWGVHPLLRFKFPAEISWEELNSGDYISIELFQNAYKDYFVFGDSGNWGRYVANDYVNPINLEGSTPLNITGFRSRYSKLFKEEFGVSQSLNKQIISKWLPDSYKQRIADLQ